MGLLDKLKGELIDIIEWIEEDDNMIACRFERYGNEIKNGAQLTVREGQIAIFVNEGELADIFYPGMYELHTENLPILSTLKGWKYGFSSPYKAEVCFLSTRIITGFGWGTPTPFRIRDPEFGILEITARGHFSFHVIDPAKFLRNVVGTEGEFTKQEIQNRLRKKFVTEAISAIAETGKSFYDMAGHYDDISQDIRHRVELTFVDQYGISLDDTSVQSIDLTEKSAQKVEARDELMFTDSRIGNYERQARADSMKLLAQNPGPGGLAAGGMGLGMGLAVANQMGGAMNPMAGGQPPMPGPGAPPPPPPAAAFHVFVNGQQYGPYQPQQIGQMAQQGQITPETQVWKPGMAGWTPASSVPELANLFQPSAPPPPPPPPPPMG